MDISYKKWNEQTVVSILEKGKYIASAMLYHASHPDGPSIWSVNVDAEYRGKGYGMIIMNEVLAEAERQGIKRLYLTVDKVNYVAMNLYFRLGFKIHGTYARRSTAWVMWKDM